LLREGVSPLKPTASSQPAAAKIKARAGLATRKRCSMANDLSTAQRLRMKAEISRPPGRSRQSLVSMMNR